MSFKESNLCLDISFFAWYGLRLLSGIWDCCAVSACGRFGSTILPPVDDNRIKEHNAIKLSVGD